MTENSVRLRLTRSEVMRLAAEGSVRERVQFANGRELRYELRSAANFKGLSASLDDGLIHVVVGEAEAKRWAESDQVGMQGGDGRPEILIEKDFQCMHGEKDPDAYQGVPAVVEA